MSRLSDIKVFWVAALAALALNFYPAAALADDLATPKPDDFARGFAVTVPESGALYKIDLPDACLSLSVDPETRDIAVFNGENALLPSAPYYPTATLKSERIAAQLTTALWKTDEAEDSSIKSGTIIIVDKDRLAAAPLEEARQNQVIPTAYLAVLPEGGLTLTGISVRWKAGQLTQIVRVRVECADDLNQDDWRLLADGPLAQVVSGAAPALESVRFALPGVTAGRYLKISFPELKAAPELLSVEAEAQRTEMPAFKNIAALLQPTAAEAAFEGENPAAIFELDMAARKWVDSVELTPASPVIWRDAVLLGRDRQEDAWQMLRKFDLFKITGVGKASPSGSVSNSVLVFQTELPRFLRVEIPASARGKSDLHLNMLYLQPGLIFQAQAPAPYTLACGSGTARIGADIDPALLALSGTASAQTAEDSKELGGDAALTIPVAEEPVDNVRVALWAVLALGAAALGGMIFTLYRNMKKGK